jgi:pantoate--beta-alanine ligase
MEIVEDIEIMRGLAEKLRNKGKRIVFVPTMGYLHDGHLSLMKYGREIGDVLVISIFVNPTQFGPGEDFQQYPRNFERDGKLAQEVGVNIIFTISAEKMYPAGYQTYVEVQDVTKNLCGKSRPGHFRGVTTVVTKLFLCVKPHIAVFGQKDAQQAAVIRQMARDLNFDIKIITAPIVREEDGLAMSSRNKYLSPEERKEALALYDSLKLAENMVSKGEISAEIIRDTIERRISEEPHARIDYVELVDAESLEPVEIVVGRVLAAVAVFVGDTRLIDNVVLEV